MERSVIVIDSHFPGLNPVQFGSEECAPGHFFGPAVRTYWLLHYVVSGKGTFVAELQEQNALRRFVLPSLALCGSAFMVIASVFSHGMGCLWYLIVFVVIMAIGYAVDQSRKKK